MPAKQPKVFIVLTDEIEDALREHAARETISMSAVVRQALMAFFVARGVTLRSPHANGHSAPSDSAA